MRLPEEPGLPPPAPAQPTRDLLLAQALDACIAAERRRPGSAREIVARQPAWARADLQRLVGLARALDAVAAHGRMSNEFRAAARARLMQRIGGAPGVHDGPVARAPTRLAPVPPGRPSSALHRLKTFCKWPAAAAALAAVLALGATVTASSSALPGEPLYRLKLAREEVGIRLAGDDQERALALLSQADARLTETARLLQLDRTIDASATTQQYDAVLERAMSSYVVTVEDVPELGPARVQMDTRLSREQEQLQTMLLSAPEAARPDLRQALVATERGRALVADPRPLEQALGRGDRRDRAVAVAVPTMAAEESPTPMPAVTAAQPAAPALDRPVLVPTRPTPPVIVAGGLEDGQP